MSTWECGKCRLQVKGAVKAIDRFEEALALEPQRRGCSGVICGHIHHADGRFELIDWAAERYSWAACACRFREALVAL